MSAKRASIAQAMMIVALAASNLFVVRAMPLEFTTYPTVWVFAGAIDFVVFCTVIRRRSLRAFHYTFLIVFVVAFIVMANLVATERVRLLGPLVRWYQQLPWVKLDSISLGLIQIGEFWMACFLSFALAVVIGFVAKRLEDRRGWDIAAFFRGALTGFGIANLLILIEARLWGWEAVSPVRIVGRLVVLGVCLIVGSLIGLSRLKSRTSAQGKIDGPAGPGAVVAADR